MQQPLASEDEPMRQATPRVEQQTDEGASSGAALAPHFIRTLHCPVLHVHPFSDGDSSSTLNAQQAGAVTVAVVKHLCSELGVIPAPWTEIEAKQREVSREQQHAECLAIGRWRQLVAQRIEVLIGRLLARPCLCCRCRQLLSSAGSSTKRPSEAHRRFLKMATSLQQTFECIRRAFESPVDYLNPAVTKRLRSIYPHVDEVMVTFGASLYSPAIIYVRKSQAAQTRQATADQTRSDGSSG